MTTPAEPPILPTRAVSPRASDAPADAPDLKVGIIAAPGTPAEIAPTVSTAVCRRIAELNPEVGCSAPVVVSRLV